MNDTKSVRSLNKLLVSLYKAIGFAILTTILVGLFSYLAVNLFYFVNRTWLAPTIISPTDERVLQLSAQLAQQSSLRDKLSADRAELVARLEDASRTLENQENYQKNFKSAVEADLAARQSELTRLQQLNTEYLAAKSEILRSNQAYSSVSRKRLDQLLSARLVAADSFVSQSYQLSQVAQSNLSLQEKEVALQTRTAALEREVRSLRAARRLAEEHQSGRGNSSADELRIEQEYQKSVLEAAKARDNVEALKESIAAVDSSLERYDKLIGSIKDSPYLQAAEKHITLAFVPYDNVSNVAAGTPIYGCSLGLVLCKNVGEVVRLLDSEVVIKHPLHNRMERGLMVHMQLKNPTWAEKEVLYLRRPPLLF